MSIFLASCAGKNVVDSESLSQEKGTKTYIYKDSCRHLVLSISLEIPIDNDSATILIRDSLISDFILSVSQSGCWEDNTPDIKPYKGNKNDLQYIVNYYGKTVFDRLLLMAKSDYEQRIAYLDEDTTITEDEKQRISKDIPQWEFVLETKKTSDTLNFIVYDSQIYCYYGGAHGGVTGIGATTFEKKSGNKIEAFLETDATVALQTVIRKGLLHYYNGMGEHIKDKELNERIQIEGTIIPLPQRCPYPNNTADSLVFTYGQYEIACYADGMPSFNVAVKDITPYLTVKGKALLDNAARIKHQKTIISKQ